MRTKTFSLLAGALSVLAAVPVAPATATATAAPRPIAPLSRACDHPTAPGRMACYALVRTDRHPAASRPHAVPGNVGFGPADIQDAYRLPSATAGVGRTVAIVDAYDLPTAESDLAAYHDAAGLPSCTTANGCFRKVNEHGDTSYHPTPDPGWGVEIALDIEMVSAACPNCHILLVEADQASGLDLVTGVDTAMRLSADAVSNSWGGAESPDQLQYDAKSLHHPGVAITASTGDGGYGVSWPASSRYVTAVGGTSLSRDTGAARGWTEMAWAGAGSGCSTYEVKPAWQADTDCPARTVADVSAVADPNTGVAVFDSYRTNDHWFEVGGTSVSSPIIASVFALAGKPANGTETASYPYASPGALNDITAGTNGGPCDPRYLCNAGPGYDGPTGLGSPNGVTSFQRQ